MAPLMIALFVALISLPLLNFLRARKIPIGISVMATLFADGVILATPLYVVGRSLKAFTREVPRYQERLNALFREALTWISERGVEVPSDFGDQVFDPGLAIDTVRQTLQGTASALSNLVLIILTVSFILLEAAGFPQKLVRAFGEEAKSSERFETIKQEVQRYLAIKTIVSILTGIIVAIGLAIIGVDFPVLWGLLAFALNYIPSLGSILAAIPPVLLALVQFDSPIRALIVVILFVLINVVLGSLVEPHFLGKSLGLSTLVVFLSLVFWGWVLGPVGMLLSVPLTMLVKIMLENTEDLRWISVLLEGSGGGTRP